MIKRSEIILGDEWRSSTGSPVKWEVTDGLVPYPLAVEKMEVLVQLIHEGEEPERVWLLEHPPLYTAGTSALDHDLKDPGRFPVYATGRGGQYTYHGPGQRVAYVMLDLNRRKRDVRAFVSALEQWLINTVGQFNINGERREDRVGIWVPRPDKGPDMEDKIAALGIRLRKWVTFHGVSLNVEPNLEHFSGIVACGVEKHGQTSLVDLGLPVSMFDADIALQRTFEEIFGPIEIV